MSTCFLMSLVVNYGSSYFKAKTSFLTFLNFGCCKPKPIGRNSDVCKPIVEENSLVLHLKASTIKKASQLAMQHHIYIGKIG